MNDAPLRDFSITPLELTHALEQYGGITAFCRFVSTADGGDWIHPDQVRTWLRRGVPRKHVRMLRDACPDAFPTC